LIKSKSTNHKDSQKKKYERFNFHKIIHLFIRNINLFLKELMLSLRSGIMIYL
jgi:hypothetical protein